MVNTPARRHAPHIVVTDGTPTTSSRDIAEFFGKRHDDVLKRIQSLGCSPEYRLRNFAETPYTNPQNGQTYTEYRLTKDGFVILAMGFTTARAMAWKERYIAHFNKMADKLAHEGQARAEVKPSALALPRTWLAINWEFVKMEVEAGRISEQQLLDLAMTTTAALFRATCTKPQGFGAEVARQITGALPLADLHAIATRSTMEMMLRVADRKVRVP